MYRRHREQGGRLRGERDKVERAEREVEREYFVRVKGVNQWLSGSCVMHMTGHMSNDKWCHLMG